MLLPSPRDVDLIILFLTHICCGIMKIVNGIFLTGRMKYDHIWMIWTSGNYNDIFKQSDIPALGKTKSAFQKQKGK